MRSLGPRDPPVIRIDALWLAVEPMDMRVGAERLFARVLHVFGEARAHHGYLFANTRANRVKLLVHDGFGVWCCGRRLNAGGFMWPEASDSTSLTLTHQQFGALVLGFDPIRQANWRPVVATQPQTDGRRCPLWRSLNGLVGLALLEGRAISGSAQFKPNVARAIKLQALHFPRSLCPNSPHSRSKSPP